MNAILSSPRDVVLAASLAGLTAAGVLLWRRLRRPARIFMCCQQTASVKPELRKWTGLRRVVSTKAAMPPFNRIEGVSLPEGAQELNLPVFGAVIQEALMVLFDDAHVDSAAAELGLHLPTSSVDPFVLGKLPKVRVLIEAARNAPECRNPTDQKAIAKLEKFVDALAALEPASVNTSAEWRAVIERHCPPSWPESLHFERILCAGPDLIEPQMILSHV